MLPKHFRLARAFSRPRTTAFHNTEPSGSCSNRSNSRSILCFLSPVEVPRIANHYHVRSNPVCRVPYGISLLRRSSDRQFRPAPGVSGLNVGGRIEGYGRHSRGEPSSVGVRSRTRAESSTMPLNFAAESFLGLITLAPDGREPLWRREATRRSFSNSRSFSGSRRR